MGVYRTGKLWSIEHFGVSPDALPESATPRPNPLGRLGQGRNINPVIFLPGSTF